LISDLTVVFALLYMCRKSCNDS